VGNQPVPVAQIGGSADPDNNLGANWQYPDSVWIAINPLNGFASSAPAATGPMSVLAGTLAQPSVYDSQQFIRARSAGASE
jgi:hypothetical protein